MGNTDIDVLEMEAGRPGGRQVSCLNPGIAIQVMHARGMAVLLKKTGAPSIPFFDPLTRRPPNLNGHQSVCLDNFGATRLLATLWRVSLSVGIAIAIERVTGPSGNVALCPLLDVSAGILPPSLLPHLPPFLPSSILQMPPLTHPRAHPTSPASPSHLPVQVATPGPCTAAGAVVRRGGVAGRPTARLNHCRRRDREVFFGLMSTISPAFADAIPRHTCDMVTLASLFAAC